MACSIALTSFKLKYLNLKLKVWNDFGSKETEPILYKFAAEICLAMKCIHIIPDTFYLLKILNYPILTTISTNLVQLNKAKAMKLITRCPDWHCLLLERTIHYLYPPGSVIHEADHTESCFSGSHVENCKNIKAKERLNTI